MSDNGNDVRVLRDLARQVADIAAKPVQDERRRLWRDHNSLIRTRPPVICTGLFFWHEVGLYESLRCRDGLLRQFEERLRLTIWRDRLNDDCIVEPYIVVPPVYTAPKDDACRWGPPIRFSERPMPGGAFAFMPCINDEADIAKLVAWPHSIDEAATAANFRKVQDAVGDILTVVQSRAPLYNGWKADISTDIARLRGLEQIMWDMCDRPAWLHRMCAFMRDGIMAQHDAAETAGDWRLYDGGNQAMIYSRDLPDPGPEAGPVERRKMWFFCAAQEMAQVSPAMHDEFILQYQLPIISKFGLSAYGCCEDLTNKIDMLRKVPNLRRISVTPFADVRRCAEQIGTDYVFSWRPSPAEMICNGWNPDRARRVLRAGMEASKGCHVDVTLKDVQTIAGNYDNLIEWVKIAREITEAYA
ncbi:MAG: hypothetical protein ACE15C_20435 [Phycisphaerae bacterium]